MRKVKVFVENTGETIERELKKVEGVYGGEIQYNGQQHIVVPSMDCHGVEEADNGYNFQGTYVLSKTKALKVLYKQWREVSQEMLDDGMNGSLDCGEKAVREDFSNFAELNETISFEDMLELENGYER